MPETYLFKPRGVIEQPSAPNRPEGALDYALNVTTKDIGLLQPRNGLRASPDGVNSAWTGGDWVAELAEFKGELMGCAINNTTFDEEAPQQWALVNGSAVPTYTEPATGNPLTTQNGFANNAPWTLARDSFYFCQQGGTRKLADPQSLEIRDIGVPSLKLYAPTVSQGTNNWLPDTEYVGYQAIVRRTDANGLIVDSPPSNTLIVQNTSGAPRRPAISTAEPVNFLLPGDKIRFYRTQNSASPNVGTEFQFAGEIDALPPGTVPPINGFLDEISPSDLGETLYTSPSRQGAEGANYRPPTGRSIDLFRRSLFWGNTTRNGLILSRTALGDRSGSATGLGVRATTGTSTGSVITVADPSGIEPGQYLVWNNAAQFTIVTAVNGANITVDPPVAPTGLPNAAVFYDTIEISDGEFSEIFFLQSDFFTPTPPLGYEFLRGYSVTGVTALATEPTRLVNTSVATPQPGFATAGYIEMFDVERPLEIRATHGEEYWPPLPGFGEDPYVNSPERGLNQLWWSKTDEPEHVPLPYFARVGADSEPILKIIATKDRLYIFKTDGIWALTGDSADAGWRIDPIDLDAKLIAPGSVRLIDESIVFLSDKGLELLSGGGIQTLSTPVSKTFETLSRLVIDTAESSRYWWQSVTAGYDPITRDYVLRSKVDFSAGVYGPELSGSNEVTETWLVYNFRSSFWTSWFSQVFTDMGPIGHVFYKGNLYVGHSTVSADPKYYSFSETSWQADEDYRTTVSRLFIDAPFTSTDPAWAMQPVTGLIDPSTDILSTGGLSVAKGVLVSAQNVPSPNNSYVIMESSTGFPDVPINVHSVFPVSVVSAPQYAGEPVELKHWAEVTARFDDGTEGLFTAYHQFPYAGNVSLQSFRTEQWNGLLNSLVGSDFDNFPISYTYPISQSEGVESRAYVPREASRATSLTTGILAYGPHRTWALQGLWLRYRSSGKRSPLKHERGGY